MTQVSYEETQAVGALNRVKGMGFKWSLNPYQGCVHDCHYCFARRYHYFRDLSPDNDFSGIVFVKLNVPDLLRRELSRPSWNYETVALGTATDPYQPIEGKYRLTRQCLEVFCRKRSPVTLVSKGTMMIRDQDLLAELSQRAGCTVCFSITTLDDDLWRRLEPGTPPPRKRLEVMERLVSAGVNAGVLLAPVIPGITDSDENLTEAVKMAAEHGARFLESNVLNLKEGTKQHFMGFLEREYPRLVRAYRGVYTGAFAPGYLREGLQTQIVQLKQVYGLGNRYDEPDSPRRPRQLELAIPQ